MGLRPPRHLEEDERAAPALPRRGGARVVNLLDVSNETPQRWIVSYAKMSTLSSTNAHEMSLADIVFVAFSLGASVVMGIVLRLSSSLGTSSLASIERSRVHFGLWLTWEHSTLLSLKMKNRQQLAIISPSNGMNTTLPSRGQSQVFEFLVVRGRKG